MTADPIFTDRTVAHHVLLICGLVANLSTGIADCEWIESFRIRSSAPADLQWSDTEESRQTGSVGGSTRVTFD